MSKESERKYFEEYAKPCSKCGFATQLKDPNTGASWYPICMCRNHIWWPKAETENTKQGEPKKRG